MLSRSPVQVPRSCKVESLRYVSWSMCSDILLVPPPQFLVPSQAGYRQGTALSVLYPPCLMIHQMPTSTNMSCHSSAQSARARAVVRVEFWLQPAGLGQASWSGTSLVGRLCAMENAGMAVTLYWDQWLLYERFPLPCAVGLAGQEPACSCPAQPFVTSWSTPSESCCWRHRRSK